MPFDRLAAHNAYAEAGAQISHWRLASGIEVDFIINDMEVAIEAKASRKVTTDQLKGLRHLRADHPKVKRGLAERCSEVGCLFACQNANVRTRRACTFR